MNLISQHISYLLLTCRKVSVPGLGTFSAYYEHAAFDPIEHIFYPSHIRISFSAKENNDRYLLEHSLKRKLKVSEKESGQHIKNFVSRIKYTLSRNSYCRIEGIGYLIKNSKGEILLKDTFWKSHKSPTTKALQI